MARRALLRIGLLAVTMGGCLDGYDPLYAVCEPGTEEACYSGPAGTEGVGSCKAGVHTCNPDGAGHGTCAGEVVPVPEDCATDADEDCDGETLDAEDGCTCEPGMQESCYTGPPDTEGVGPCKAGIHTCDATGKSYGVCLGEAVPQAEHCDTPGVDESCDAEPTCTGVPLGSKRFGDAVEQGGFSVAADREGNIVLAGTFQGSVDFGGGALTSAGFSDIFVAKFDPQLNHLYSKRFGDAEDQYGGSLAVDGEGNILLTGSFGGSVDFGGGPLTSVNYYDIYVAKLDPQLDHLHSKRFGDVAIEFSSGIAVDGAGNVVLTGAFVDGSIDFGGGPLTNAGSHDIFVAKLDPQLDHLHSKSFGDALGQSSSSVVVDGEGNVVLAGDFGGSIDFGGGPLTSVVSPDIFVAKLDPQLDHLHSKSFGQPKDQYCERVAVDGEGNVVLVGHFDGSVDFGGGVLTDAGNYDTYVAKLDPQLDHLHSKRFGDTDQQQGHGLAVDGAGNVVLTGFFGGSVDFGGGALTSAGLSDIFVAKLDSQLDHLWSERFGDPADQYAESVAVDGGGNVLLTGYFEGSVDFGGGPLTSAGSRDIFVAKLAP